MSKYTVKKTEEEEMLRRQEKREADWLLLLSFAIRMSSFCFSPQLPDRSSIIKQKEFFCLPHRLSFSEPHALRGFSNYKKRQPIMDCFLRVEHRGFEPLTSTMRTLRATNCANALNFHAVFVQHY